jgi:hypothetical protein
LCEVVTRTPLGVLIQLRSILGPSHATPSPRRLNVDVGHAGYGCSSVGTDSGNSSSRRRAWVDDFLVRALRLHPCLHSQPRRRICVQIVVRVRTLIELKCFVRSVSSLRLAWRIDETTRTVHTIINHHSRLRLTAGYLLRFAMPVSQFMQEHQRRRHQCPVHGVGDILAVRPRPVFKAQFADTKEQCGTEEDCMAVFVGCGAGEAGID